VTVESFPLTPQIVGPLAGIDVFRSAAQSLPASAWAAISWDTATPHGPTPLTALWSAANPTRLYADRDGWWLCSATVVVNSAAGSWRILTIRNSAGSYWTNQSGAPLAGGGAHYMSTSRVIWMTAGDWVDVAYYSDVALTTSTGSFCNCSWQPVQGVKGDPGTSGPMPNVVGGHATINFGAAGTAAAIPWSSLTAGGPAPLSPLWSSGQPTRLYADRAGLWQVSVYVQSNSGGPSSATFNLAVRWNGSTYLANLATTASASFGWAHTISKVVNLNAGDYIEVMGSTSAQCGALDAGGGQVVWSPLQGAKGDVGPAASRSAWTNIATSPGWAANWGEGAGGAPWSPCAWQTSADGGVYLRGLAGWTPTTTPDGSLMFTLPAAIRPSGVNRLLITRWAVSASNLGYCRIDVQLDGQVICREFQGTAPANWAATWVSLSPLSWSTV